MSNNVARARAAAHAAWPGLPALRMAARHHLESAKAAAQGIPWWVWPVPLACGAALLLLLETPLAWLTDKPTQEIAAPVIIGQTAVFAALVHRWVRETFTAMLACFAWALFLRELHFPGTNTGFYIALALLAWWASSKRDAIADYLRAPAIAGLLASAVWTYFVTKLLDRHYLSFLPDYLRWHDPLEESLETIGHMLVFGLVMVTLAEGLARAYRAKPAQPRAAEQSG